MKKTAIFAIVLTLLVPQIVLASGKKVTLVGVVGGGTGSSYIEVGDKQYTFGTDTSLANKIFKACKDGDKCSVVAILDRDGELDKVISATKVVITAVTSSRLVLTIAANEQVAADKDIKKRLPIEVKGTIEYGHDAAGGNYWVNGGKKKQYALKYIFELDDKTQDELGRLADSRAKVTVKGILKIWKDGSASFDDAQPITIYK